MERNSRRLADERLPHALFAQNMAFTIAQTSSSSPTLPRRVIRKAREMRKKPPQDFGRAQERCVETAGNVQAALFLTAGAAVFPGVVIAVMITRSITSGESRLPSGTGTRGTA